MLRPSSGGGRLIPAPGEADLMWMRTKLLLAAACLATGSAFLPGAAGSYVAAGKPWPGGVVRYYDAAPDQGWAVKQAVAAWNSSGARVRLVAAAPSEADVRIEHFPRVTCTINAEATVGYTSAARIWIFRRNDSSPYCNRYMAAQALAHEFGHVLGLGHETRGCSAMNPVGSLQGPQLCAKAHAWQWRCAVLTSDDVAGAVALYGGTARAQRGPEDCDLYRSEAAPRRVAVTPTTTPNLFIVAFTRPSPAHVPAFLASQRRLEESFVVGSSTTSCPTVPYAFARETWEAAVGATQQTRLLLPTGTSCIGVWSVDSFGRPSDRPAVLSVRVVPPAGR